MLDTYIKNKGITKTIIHNNSNVAKVNEIQWDADYDGNMAHLNVDINEDGRREKFNLQMDNDDIAAILNIPSMKGSLEDRLERDFIRKQYNTPKLIHLYDDDLTHISSPLPQEQLIVPLKIVKRKTSKRRNKRRKSRRSSRSRRSPRSTTRRITL